MDWYDTQMFRIQEQFNLDLLTDREAREEEERVRKIYRKFKRTAVINTSNSRAVKNDNVIYVEFRK